MSHSSGGVVPADVPLSAAGRSLAQRLRQPLMLSGGAVVALGGGYFFLTAGQTVSTDDAYLQCGRVSISADVSGRVVAVDVGDNQLVRPGQALFKLDDRPFRIAVEKTEAELASARLKVQAEKAAYRQAQAELAAAQDTQAFRQREFDRQTKLLAAGAAAQVQFEQAGHALDAAKRQVIVIQQQAMGLLASLAGDADIPLDRHPSVRQAQSALDHARLNLQYTSVAAPADGVVTKVSQLQVGDYVSAGVPVFSLMSSHDVWIEANFKENDIGHMAPGQKASVAVDTYPDRMFTARVISFSPGTGSAFSLLPAENATGNWVKVGQRLPVRLELEHPDADPTPPFFAGLSVSVEVRTQYRHPVLQAVRRLLMLDDGR